MSVCIHVRAQSRQGGPLPAARPCYRLGMAEERSLEALMARYVRGDLGAFDEIYARTSQRVFAFLMFMCGDRARAEDLCQTTYLKLHRARGGWMEGSPVVPWMMAIARNAFVDDARSLARARAHASADGHLSEARQVDTSATTDTPSFELREAIDSAIDALSPLQREAFVLTKHSGLSPRDAALVLGTSETAVKLRVHRAYVALRAALEPYRAGDK